jgi:uncharacterized protein YkwD
VRAGVGRIVVAIMVAATMLCGCAFAETPALRAERQLFTLINMARRANSLPPLRWDDSLAIAAGRHAEVMAEHQSAQHGFGGEPSLSVRVKLAGARFSWLSENVIQGSSAEYIHAQFMNSSAHRANILDRDMDSVGVGVVERNGQLFAVEDFSQAR